MAPFALVTLLAALPAGVHNGEPALQERRLSTAPFREARLKRGHSAALVLAGRRYEVHVHFDDLVAARRALATVEAVWPVAMQHLDATGTEPPHLLEVHLYPTQADYEEVEAILTDGWFRNTGSFAHWTSRTAHVAMAPPLAGEAARRVVLSAQTREMLIHEAAHLATYVVIPTYRWHPTWFSEGLVMSVEQEVARRLGLLDTPREHPRYSTDQVLLQRLAARHALPSAARILSESLDTLTFHERYAVELEFFAMLREEWPEACRELVAEAKRLPGRGAFRKGMAEFVARRFVENELDERLRARVVAMTPAWYLDYRSLSVDGELWTQAAFPSTPAVAWRTAPVGRASYALAGAFEPLGESMSVRLHHVGWSCISVELFRDGSVVVARRERDVVSELARGTSAELAAGGAHDFEVRVDGGEVRVRIDGRECVAVDVGDEPLDGPWGLAVPPGAAGLWSGVRLVE